MTDVSSPKVAGGPAIRQIASETGKTKPALDSGLSVLFVHRMFRIYREIRAMALTTTYIVVPFLAGARSALHPGVPRRSTSRPTAIATADALAPFYAGVIVLRDRSDPAAQIFLEPLLICVIGEVPGDLLRQLAA